MTHVTGINQCCQVSLGRNSLPLKSLNMADHQDFISTDHQFVIEYYWEDLVKRINISSSSLIDYLVENRVFTEEEGESYKVLISTCNEN